MEADERTKASRVQVSAINSSRGSGDSTTNDSQHVRRRSEATTPSTFDAAAYRSHVLASPEHFDPSNDADFEDAGSSHEPRFSNGAFAHEAWQKKRRKREGYNLLGGMMMQQEGKAPASRWAIKLADRQVLQRSAVNVLLIGLWYLFSTSISIVRPSPALDFMRRILLTAPAVQQMDVLAENLPLSPLHDEHAHARAVLVRLGHPVLLSAIPTST